MSQLELDDGFEEDEEMGEENEGDADDEDIR